MVTAPRAEVGAHQRQHYPRLRPGTRYAYEMQIKAPPNSPRGARSGHRRVARGPAPPIGERGSTRSLRLFGYEPRRQRIGSVRHAARLTACSPSGAAARHRNRIPERLTVRVADDERPGVFLDHPRRRETARGWHGATITVWRRAAAEKAEGSALAIGFLTRLACLPA
jgi:hypothetical protein